VQQRTWRVAEHYIALGGLLLIYGSRRGGQGLKAIFLSGGCDVYSGVEVMGGLGSLLCLRLTLTREKCPSRRFKAQFLTFQTKNSGKILVMTVSMRDDP
jgi:hypothetical protein